MEKHTNMSVKKKAIENLFIEHRNEASNDGVHAPTTMQYKYEFKPATDKEKEKEWLKDRAPNRWNMISDILKSNTRSTFKMPHE